ncbi:MAG TPA: hypothetical protein VGO91_14200 [Pyrinomonadaceae bacterium]|jgi:hypothetical protein|nr:hypothetical protein [Pyrinomonadaceae bacterium]
MPDKENQDQETAHVNQATSEDTFSLARRLTKIGYPALFKEADHEHLLDEVWKSASQQDFERLVGDTKAPSLARFLGSQILLGRDMTFFSRTDLNSLSDVYVQALLGNYTKTMTDWGFLHRNDDTGLIGSIFLVFGERSIPQLVNLLSDGTVVDYQRPFPDVSGFNPTRLQKVRIKDFAALYLSQIKNIPLELKTSFDERDKEIINLKNKLLPE